MENSPAQEISARGTFHFSEPLTAGENMYSGGGYEPRHGQEQKLKVIMVYE